MKKILLFTIISVLAVSVSVTSIYAQSQYEIPAWVKGIAGFWAEDKITDSEFGEGLSFLIDNGIIKVPLIEELKQENIELKQTISQLEQNSDIQISTSISFDFEHSITGGKITNITPYYDSASLFIDIETFADGRLEIALPRNIMDSIINGKDVEYFAVVDGEEVYFKEYATDEVRILTIDFPKGAKEIMIVGTWIAR